MYVITAEYAPDCGTQVELREELVTSSDYYSHLHKFGFRPDAKLFPTTLAGLAIHYHQVVHDQTLDQDLPSF